MNSATVDKKKQEKRVRYYTGQTLRAEDLLHDQEYHIDRLRRHNRLLHPQGVLEGLTVTLDEAAGQLSVAPGTAMDSDGRLVVLSKTAVIRVDELPSLPAFLVINYNEVHSDQYDPDDNTSHVRTHEAPVLTLVSENNTSPDVGVILAKVNRAGETLTVDHSHQANAPLEVRGGLSISLESHDPGAGNLYVAGQTSTEKLNVQSIQADQPFWMPSSKLQLDDANQLYFGQCLARSEHWLVVTDSGYLPAEAGAVFVYDVHNPQQPAQKLQAFQNTTFAPDVEDSARFGISAALDGNWLIIGEPNKKDNREPAKTHVGAVYIFQLEQGTWTPHSKIEAFDEIFVDGVLQDRQIATETDALFGQSSAIKGHWIAVAAPFKTDENYQQEGAVYLFNFDGSQWQPQQILTAFSDDLTSNYKNNNRFGYSLAMDDKQLLVGAPGGGLGSGYLFELIESQWLPVVRLKPFNDDLSLKTGVIGQYNFGVAVALHQHRLVIGAENPIGVGGAFVFSKTNDHWTAEKALKPFKEHSDGSLVPDTLTGTRFGWSVSVFQDQVVVGAIFANNPLDARSGVAYLFECNESLVNYAKKVLYPWINEPDGTRSISNHNGSFGHKVVVLENDIFVAATQNRNSAAVYQFSQYRPSIKLNSIVEVTGNLKTSGTVSVGQRLQVNTLDSGGSGIPVLWDNNSKLFFADTSSLRNKENIQNLDDNFFALLSIDPKIYTRPGHPQQLEVGYLAEDLDAAGLKHLVLYDKDGQAQGVYYHKISLYLAKIVQQQHKTIMELQQNEQENNKQFDDLARRISVLEEKTL